MMRNRKGNNWGRTKTKREDETVEDVRFSTLGVGDARSVLALVGSSQLLLGLETVLVTLVST